MAIRQYVGARYVPRFTGLYDATQVYDALDVVDNGAGTSYIAKKTVPAGTPLTNTDYWFMYGATSGAILDLQSRVGQLETDIKKIAANRKFVLVGDSFSIGVTATGDPWTTGWADYMHSILPDNVFYSGAGGSGFTTGGTDFLECLTNVYNALPVDPEIITDIVVLGGTNEGNSETEASIAAAIDGFCTQARNLFPNADISIGIVGLNARRMVNDLYTYKGYRTGASRNGCKFLTDAINLGADPNEATANGHWTVAGYAKYNPYIAQLIVSGHCHFCFNWDVAVALDPNCFVTPSVYHPTVNFLVTEKGVRLSVFDPSFDVPQSPYLNNKILIGSNRTQAIFDFPANTKIYAAFSLGYTAINGNSWYINAGAQDTQFCSPIALSVNESGGAYKIIMKAALPVGSGSKSSDSNYISMISHDMVGIEMPITVI